MSPDNKKIANGVQPLEKAVASALCSRKGYFFLAMLSPKMNPISPIARG
jgi:hypothetical protein